VLVACVTALVTVGPVPVRPAQASCSGCGVQSDPGAAAYRGSLLLPAGTDPALAATAARCYGCSWVVEPQCGDSPASDAICFGATHRCAPGWVRMQLFLQRPGWPGFRLVGGFCLGPGQLLTPVGLDPGVRAQFLTYLPALAPSFQPRGRGIVNLPVVFATGQPSSLGLKAFPLGGHRILLDATATWHWAYGDGAVQDTSSPGSGYPDLSVSHTYTQPGSAMVTVTTTWAGQYWVDGSGPFAVAGPALTQSATVAVAVREALAVLVG